nr:hypothetical protein Iba_chr02aCG17330 [Ipomoea batatas]GMC65172.1 hypothetical protein Iba_chr02dCG11710 [Ipomoea batatas]GMC68581.1 hypothetical protein Iba_chr02fCG13270 [Ipomoea batatas]
MTIGSMANDKQIIKLYSFVNKHPLPEQRDEIDEKEAGVELEGENEEQRNLLESGGDEGDVDAGAEDDCKSSEKMLDLLPHNMADMLRMIPPLR